MTTIAEVLDSFPEKQSAALWSVHSSLESLLPLAEQDMSWGMPTFRCEGIIVTSLHGISEPQQSLPRF